YSKINATEASLIFTDYNGCGSPMNVLFNNHRTTEFSRFSVVSPRSSVIFKGMFSDSGLPRNPLNLQELIKSHATLLEIATFMEPRMKIKRFL
ncbi:MAG: hypothetical protein DRI57_12435, partial [Deltaproteobacteria bacterium]